MKNMGLSSVVKDVVDLALLPVIFFVSIGWFIGTINVITPQHIDGLNRYALHISLPAMALLTLTKFAFSG